VCEREGEGGGGEDRVSVKSLTDHDHVIQSTIADRNPLEIDVAIGSI
jgi:hypothetical protein